MFEPSPVWPWITLGLGRVERSRATDAASLCLAEPLELQSRVAAEVSGWGGPLSAALTLVT